MSQDLLRLTTAGSVDDGKSTLIGRLLLESKALYRDQIEQVRQASERQGFQGLDLSLFTDGLRAEREQKITIDVAYRYFSTPRRHFIIADCPGHLQYTRNMVTGASTSELAVILVDARHGLVTQSKRHAFLSTLLGLPHLVVAVNKMDLVSYDQERYLEICDQFQDFARKLEVGSLTFLPISALHGDNVVERSPRTPWYEGSTLLHTLETVNVGAARNVVDFRFPVQCVLRPDQNYRGYAGRVSSGRVQVGEEIVVLPSGIASTIAAIDVYEGARENASVGESVILRLTDHVDVSRGDLIVRRNNLPVSADEIDATLCWLGEEPLDTQRRYLLRHGTRNLNATIITLDYRIDVDTMHRESVPALNLNDIGRARLKLSATLHFDAYKANRETGCFLLIDATTHDTVAAGMIRGRARTPEPREEPGLQKPAVIWLTGLSGSGKSTIAQAFKERYEQQQRLFMLDGDAMREHLSADLGFTPQDRQENIRRAGAVAKLAYDQGFLILCTLISPFEADRTIARALFPEGDFLEVHVDCSLEECQKRDPKGLYARAASGQLANFTGISSPYEPPRHPHLVLDTSVLGVEEAVDKLRDLLQTRRES